MYVLLHAYKVQYSIDMPHCLRPPRLERNRFIHSELDTHAEFNLAYAIGFKFYRIPTLFTSFGASKHEKFDDTTAAIEPQQCYVVSFTFCVGRQAVLYLLLRRPPDTHRVDLFNTRQIHVVFHVVLRPGLYAFNSLSHVCIRRICSHHDVGRSFTCTDISMLLK